MVQKLLLHEWYFSYTSQYLTFLYREKEVNRFFSKIFMKINNIFQVNYLFTKQIYNKII